MIRTGEPLSAAVLAGGQSRRMGQDKAFLSLSDGGPTLLGIVLERLAAVADDLLIVANDPGRYASFGVRVAPDVYPGTGALGGIHAAVTAAAYDHCLVVACDMPFLNPPLLARMAAEPRDYDVLIPVLPGESRQRRGGVVYQTLHAIYGKSCLPAIEARFAREALQVVGFFDDVAVRTIALPEIRALDPDLRSFFNANTPEALAEASRLAVGTERSGDG